MGRQQSQQTSRGDRDSPLSRRGTSSLFIVGMPIGSPDDLTFRARTILGRVSIVVAETPLAARTLLEHYGITANITGYERGDKEKIAILLDRMHAGHDIALVCDAGMPVIYDPGRRLIAAARAAGHTVTVVPGPSALTAAAALSGLSADRLLFVGRLPRSLRHLDRFLRSLLDEPATAVMFAAASAVPRIVERMARILPERPLTLAVNMTKADERVYQGKADALIQRARSLPKDSEVTLVLSGARERRRRLIAAES